MIKCPVCPANNIPDDSKICPNCGADFSPIHKLRELAATHYNDALQMAEAGATDSAISQVMGVLAINEHFTEARKLLGKLLWKKKHFREAVNQWEQASAFASEDKEIKDLLVTAKRRLKLRMIRNIAGFATAVAIFVFVLLVPIYAFFKIIDGQLEQMVENNKNAELQYAKLIGRLHISEQKGSEQTSNHLEDLKQRIEYLKKQQENTAFVLAEATETSKRGEEEFIQQIKDLKRQQENTVSILAEAIVSSRKEIADTKAEVKVQRRHLSKSLVPLFESIRPANTEALTEQIHKLQNKLEKLHGLEEKYQSRNLFIIDVITRGIVKDKLRRVEAQLKQLQDEYQAHVVPWEQALKMVKTLADEKHIAEPPRDSNQIMNK